MVSTSVASDATAVSVVVPVYKSERVLSELVAELGPVLERLATAYELILVNDGSPDASGQVAADLADQHSWIRSIDLLRNYGQHSALLCGIRAAAHPIVVTMDDDLQNPPEEIGALLRKLDEGFDVVYGWPRREQHGLWRAVVARITKLALQRVLGAETARRVSGFRALRTQLRNAFAGFQGPSVNLDVLLTWGTDRFTSVDVHHRSRHSGTSGYTSRKLIEHALNMLTGFTTVPLQAAAVLGFGASIFGFVLLCYVLGRYFLQSVAVPGFTFLASVIIIFSGTQLFTLGVVGEYLARMHFRMMAKPAYVVRADRPGIRHQPGDRALCYCRRRGRPALPCPLRQWRRPTRPPHRAATSNGTPRSLVIGSPESRTADSIRSVRQRSSGGARLIGSRASTCWPIRKDLATVRTAADCGFRVVDVRVTLAVDRPGNFTYAPTRRVGPCVDPDRRPVAPSDRASEPPRHAVLHGRAV